MNKQETLEAQYSKILQEYMNNQSEQALYAAQQFSRTALEKKVPPEEVISLQKNAMQQLMPDLSPEVWHSFDILLEVMTAYGFAFREHQSLLDTQKELKNEMEIASNVQDTLLGTSVPSVDGLEIGALSVPAKQMNGDYYHFVHDGDHSVNVAIADVIGKGIPAALCMSMIKYAMDSLPEYRKDPSAVLESLNRVVEQNVDDSMFITMFYGMYELRSNILHFASAGHEPGFFYRHKDKEFLDLEARGLLLGVDKNAKYKRYEQAVEIGDMIILMSDGVTECRTDEGFIERETLISYINEYIELPPQEIVNKIFRDLERLQHFQLRDDFTIIILKRTK
ncbi:PP2C family protein-serine/threonine phosphatase [Jeotgalibacillus haloalkalitolerans]|uniref:PP2C family protein-serine/threonine phosphatase n=1 Tax=Jeotgalibacillus haloalkalitolerans TaxID=3104292 RepID=A0ABU5KPR2_9BACL|nr:PP2C family protein-serine/threonine phosphatase [Jeotgalibacillus sp. HH7-29]MDZ5713147.1 PP2C family protein-serine/threonine phosphatase [Jeotgalibacillus sp. HH7-29]